MLLFFHIHICTWDAMGTRERNIGYSGTAAFSTPAIYSRIFHSCIFHPCYLLLHFPLLHFPLPHFQRPPQISNLVQLLLKTIFFRKTAFRPFKIIQLRSLICHQSKARTRLSNSLSQLQSRSYNLAPFRRYSSFCVLMTWPPPLFQPNFGSVPVAPNRPCWGQCERYLKLFGREINFEVFQPMWSCTVQTDRRADDMHTVA